MAETIQLPTAVDSEREVISALIIEGKEAIKRIGHIVTAEDFYEQRHAIIWRAALSMYERQVDIDIVTLSEFLQQKGYLDVIGGSTYLMECTNMYISLAHLPTHARIVADRAVARRIIRASQDIIRKAAEADDIEKFVSEAEDTLKGVTRSAVRAENKLAIVDMEEWRKIARETEPTPGTVRGLSSGWRAVDDITEGFEGGEMYILTGHTGHGKSQLATGWAINVAQKGSTVLFINTEMTKLQMGRRLNSILGDEPIKGKIIVNDRSDIDAKDVITIMENAKEKGCDMVIVDHLHYFARSEDNATGQISKYTKEFKDAAVNLDIPLLMLCHIDQSKPETMRPTLKMLKNSSSIAQDADLVMTVFRDEQKNPGVLEVIRLKGRSTSGKHKWGELYYDGLKLTEQKPVTAAPDTTYYDNNARMLGEKDEVDLDIPNW